MDTKGLVRALGEEALLRYVSVPGCGDPPPPSAGASVLSEKTCSHSPKASTEGVQRQEWVSRCASVTPESV